MRGSALLALWLAAATPAAVLAHAAGQGERRLPTIGPAPEFALTAQDGERVALADLRGKAVAVGFVYTHCPDVCPLLTDRLAAVKDALGPDFGARVAFVSVTVDPARDTPGVLKAYAQAYGADVPGWRFLTGDPAAVGEVARGFGVAVARSGDGEPDHTTLTTLVDKRGAMRVQYLGVRFDPVELRRDLLELAGEP